MFERKRPVAAAERYTYQCPENYVACNEEWLSNEFDAQHAICIPEYDDIEDDCPITSFAFSLDGMSASEKSQYKQADNFGTT